MQDTPGFVSPPPLLMVVERLERCWDNYRSDLRRARRDFANEYVHDLRVSIRRLVSALELGRSVVHQKELKKSRRLLESQLDAFDALRDTQVQLTIVEELQEDLPEITPYRDYLREREKRQVSQVKKKITDFQPAGLARQVARLRKALLTRKIPEADSAIWMAVDESYSTVLHRWFAVGAEDSASIHRLRLDFKKFRYLVESTFPLMNTPPDDFLRHLHDYQAAMGEIQDVEVGLELLAAFTAKTGTELPGVKARFNEMRQARIQAFIGSMNEVESFWRTAPDKKYPWQLKKRTPSHKAKGTT